MCRTLPLDVIHVLQDEFPPPEGVTCKRGLSVCGFRSGAGGFRRLGRQHLDFIKELNVKRREAEIQTCTQPDQTGLLSAAHFRFFFQCVFPWRVCKKGLTSLMMQKGFLELLGSLKNSEVSDPQRTKTLVNKKRLKLSTD